MPTSLYYQQWRCLYVCQRIKRASARGIFPFCVSPFQFYGLDGGEKKRVPASFTLNRDIFGMHSNGLGVRACGTMFYFNLCPFCSHVLGGESRESGDRSLCSQRRRFWNACQRVGKRASGIIFLRLSPVCFYGLGGGGKGVPAGSTLSGSSTFRIQASGSGRRACGTFQIDKYIIFRSVLTDRVGGGREKRGAGVFTLRDRAFCMHASRSRG